MADTKSFKENVTALEEITQKLENEELDLEEAIALYEKGVEISKLCMKTLQNAELKITKLKSQLDGEVDESDLSPDDE